MAKTDNTTKQVTATLPHQTLKTPNLKISDEIIKKPIFREVVDFYIGANLVCLLATDTTSTITEKSGVLGKKINQMLIDHKRVWRDLKDNVVSIAITDSTSDETKVFDLCFRSFVLIFGYPDELFTKMKKAADELSKTWNKLNSGRNKHFVKRESTKIIPLNVISIPLRGTKNKFKHVELVMAATTFNYTRDVQHLKTSSTCTPENVFFQLRYQHNDSHSVMGQLSLPLLDWQLFLHDAMLQKFVAKLFGYINDSDTPLDEPYLTKIEQYYNVVKPIANKDKKSNDDDNLFSNSETPEEYESDADEPSTKKTKK